MHLGASLLGLCTEGLLRASVHGQHFPPAFAFFRHHGASGVERSSETRQTSHLDLGEPWTTMFRKVPWHCKTVCCCPGKNRRKKNCSLIGTTKASRTNTLSWNVWRNGFSREKWKPIPEKKILRNSVCECFKVHKRSRVLKRTIHQECSKFTSAHKGWEPMFIKKVSIFTSAHKCWDGLALNTRERLWTL